MSDSPKSSVDPRGRVKGLAIREILRSLKDEVGAARLLETLRTLPPDWAGRIDLSADGLGMLPSTWYPMSMIHAVLDKLLVGLNMQDRSEAARAAARAMANATLDGVHRSLFELFGTPELYIRYAQKIWGMYYDRGTYEAEVVGHKRVLTSTRDWPGHHVFLCEAAIEVSAITFEKMGLKEVRGTRMACVAGGAPMCTALITWDEARPPSRPGFILR
jgi:hypothetical protein